MKILPSSISRLPSPSALQLIFFTIFLDILGFGILVPVIPFLVQPFDHSALTIGLLTMSFSIAQFFASPVLGALSDRYGRRPVLLISIFGAGVAYIVFGLAWALWVFFAARIVDGLTGGNISTAQAYIADVSAPKDRSKNFGLIGAAFGAGFIIGPAIGGVMSHISYSAPAYLAGFLCLLSCLFGFFILPESLPPEKRRRDKMKLSELNPVAQLTGFLGQPGIAANFLLILMQGLGMNILRSNFMIYARDKFGYGPDQVGYLYTFLGIMVVGTQSLLVRRIVSRLGDGKTAFFGFIGMFLGFAWMATSPGIYEIFGIMLLVAVGNGLVYPTVSAMTSGAVSGKQQGGVMGAQQSISSITMIFGPLIAGATYDHISHGAPYALAAICAVAGVYLCYQSLWGRRGNSAAQS